MEGPPSHTRSILLSSAISGAVARLLIHPADTLRARLQNERTPKGTSRSSTRTSHLLKDMIRNEGWRSLYKGLGIALSFSVPGTMAYLTVYEKLKIELTASGKIPQNSLTHLTAALTAEFVSGLVWTPMDVIKQKLQVETASGSSMAKYKNSTHAIRVIYVEEGIRGLYRGYFANLSVFGPFSMIYFVVYEKLKSRLGNNFGSYIVSATMAGAVAAAATSPLDVVKTRLQVQSQHSVVQYSSIAQAISRMMKEEGVRVFSKGLLARVLWIAPSTGINLSLFETLKKLI